MESGVEALASILGMERRARLTAVVSQIELRPLEDGRVALPRTAGVASAGCCARSRLRRERAGGAVKPRRVLPC
jgi:hypothetical protein